MLGDCLSPLLPVLVLGAPPWGDDESLPLSPLGAGVPPEGPEGIDEPVGVPNGEGILQPLSVSAIASARVAAIGLVCSARVSFEAVNFVMGKLLSCQIEVSLLRRIGQHYLGLCRFALNPLRAKAHIANIFVY